MVQVKRHLGHPKPVDLAKLGILHQRLGHLHLHNLDKLRLREVLEEVRTE